MESYQVYAAFETSEQFQQGIRVSGCVIVPCKHCVLKADSSLSAEVILLDESDNLGD